jgi:heat shock protein HslJ
MKYLKKLFLFTSTFVVISCASTSNISQEQLFESSWELESFSDANIDFDTIFPNKKPTITFDKNTQKAFGNNSCNGFIAPYFLNKNAISFGEPGAATLMYCGEGEQFFLKAMKKVTNFRIDNQGSLVLMGDKNPLLRFKKRL